MYVGDKMKNPTIVFTKPQTAELLQYEIGEPKDNEVLTETEYSVVSGGTERACLMNSPNTPQHFPCRLGYCSIGKVIKTGQNVKSVAVGDRVLVYHGCHAKYNIRTEDEITKVKNEKVDSLYAAFVIIASMGLGGTRKLELEIGESAMVVGLGLLGMFSVQFCRLSGANPVIAVDFSKKRRELALKLGADYAFDPSDPEFEEKVKEATGGRGVNGCIEVTGNSAALVTALNCASYMGRIALLGCTRVSDSKIDFYTQVHRPGIKIIGAHNFVRPKKESYPHHWTHHDDCCAIIDMIATGRIDVKSMISRVETPENCSKVYEELCFDKDFPLGTVFDWRNIK